MTHGRDAPCTTRVTIATVNATRTSCGRYGRSDGSDCAVATPRRGAMLATATMTTTARTPSSANHVWEGNVAHRARSEEFRG